jgi:hypothetical protein
MYPPGTGTRKESFRGEKTKGVYKRGNRTLRKPSRVRGDTSDLNLTRIADWKEDQILKHAGGVTAIRPGLSATRTTPGKLGKNSFPTRKGCAINEFSTGTIGNSQNQSNPDDQFHPA